MCVCVCFNTHTHEHTQVSVLTAAIEKAIKAEAEVLSLRYLGSSPQACWSCCVRSYSIALSL